MAWGRVIELSIGADGTGLAIEGLDIDFKVEKTQTLAENYGEFVIYNAKESTRKNILKKGNNIIFSVGYEDESTAVAFIGNIESSISEKVTGGWKTTIQAYTLRAKNISLGVVPVSLSYAPGVSLTDPISELAQLTGLVLTGSENAQGITLPNGWTFAGTLSGAFRYIDGILQANGIGVYLDNQEVVIFREDGESRFKVVNLSYKGGLLSVKEITKTGESKKRIQFTSLIIPQIRISGLVVLTNTGAFDGVYSVDKLALEGNNYGGKFEISGEATA